MKPVLRITDESGNVILDTTRIVLRELVATVASATTTTEQSISISPDPASTVIAQATSETYSAGAFAPEIIDVRIDGSSIKYRFKETGSFDADIRALVF